MERDTTKKIAALNDLARTSMGVACRLVQTQGDRSAFGRGSISD
jgi:hypothetical protein